MDLQLLARGQVQAQAGQGADGGQLGDAGGLAGPAPTRVTNRVWLGVGSNIVTWEIGLKRGLPEPLRGLAFPGFMKLLI